MNGVMKIGLLLAVSSLALLVTDDVDGEESYDAEYNCNNYNLSFIYSGGTVGDITVSWSAYGIDKDGKHIPVEQTGDAPSKGNNWKVRFNPEDVKLCKIVFVKQTIETPRGDKDEMTIKVNVITPPPERGFFDVRFFDGYSGALISVVSVYGDKVVQIGDDFVKPPGAPIREGYSFLGWFLPTENPDIYVPFNPKDPVESDLDVYAKWTSDSSKPVPNPSNGVKSLTVSGDYKKEYSVGDHLNINGLKITATYYDDSIADVTSMCEFSPSVFNYIGKITITATYGGMTALFTVNVSDSSSSDSDDADDSDKNEAIVDAHVLNYALIGLVVVLGGVIAYKFLGRGGA